MAPTIPNWLSHEVLMDAGEHRALYPYPRLENILSPADCRKAVLPETAAFEEEFGIDLVTRSIGCYGVSTRSATSSHRTPMCRRRIINPPSIGRRRILAPPS